MTDIRCRFLERIERTPWVSSFRFRPELKIDFLPGQFLQVVFDEQHPQNRSLNKYLSFSSSPDRDDFEVTKRDRGSEFSRRLWALQPGQDLLMKGPMGKCVLKKDFTRIGFLVGGIGITPVIAMIETIIGRQIPAEVKLLYSNLRENDIPYKKELDHWQRENPWLDIVYTVVEEKPRDPAIQFGLMDQDFVARHLPDIRERTIFLLGPPGMVQAMDRICRDLGCPAEHILSERFVGYD